MNDNKMKERTGKNRKYNLRKSNKMVKKIMSLIDKKGIWKTEAHMALTMVPKWMRTAECMMIYDGEPISEDEKQGIKLFVTFLFTKYGYTEEEKEINNRLITAFYLFGERIGKESVVIIFANNLKAKEIDFKRNLNLIKKLKLKPADAPYMIFSRKPLDEIIDPKEEDILELSFNIKDEQKFSNLIKEVENDVLYGEYPGRWIKIKMWLEQDHPFLEKIWKGLKEATNLLKPFIK